MAEYEDQRPVGEWFGAERLDEPTPTWEWPVSIPRFTTDKFQQEHEKYVAEHGYRVRFPRFDDIIHLGFEHKPTREELKWFYLKRWDKLGPGRMAYIETLVEKRRRRYIKMLESPVPRFYRNIASIMTMIDDIEDTLSTVAVLGRVAAKFAPRMFARLFMGPLGWIMLAADLLNLAQVLTCLPFTLLGSKRAAEDLFLLNPFCKEAKLKRAKKMKRWWPGLGDLLEVAQTTDNIFGVGVSLGPLVGFAADYAAGTYRMAAGDKVQFGSSPPQMYPHEYQVLRGFRALPFIWACDSEISDDDKFMTSIAANLMTQVIRPWTQIWNPLDHILNLDDIELLPPKVTNPLTRLVFEEQGLDPDDFVGFPSFSPEEPTFKNLSTQLAPRATDNYNKYSYRNRHNMPGWISGNNTTEYAENMLSIIEDTIDIITPLRDQPKAILDALKEIYETDYYFAEKALHPAQYLIFMKTWKGYYLGSVPVYPIKGFKEGPVEWDYDKNYNDIWNPPKWERDRPKTSPYDRIKWILEHEGTPWYIKYCQWGFIKSGYTGWDTKLWYVARAFAELKVPYNINPTWSRAPGLRNAVRVNFYCKEKCRLDLMPPDLMEESMKIFRITM